MSGQEQPGGGQGPVDSQPTPVKSWFETRRQMTATGPEEAAGEINMDTPVAPTGAPASGAQPVGISPAPTGSPAPATQAPPQAPPQAPTQPAPSAAAPPATPTTIGGQLQQMMAMMQQMSATVQQVTGRQQSLSDYMQTIRNEMNAVKQDMQNKLTGKSPADEFNFGQPSGGENGEGGQNVDYTKLASTIRDAAVNAVVEKFQPLVDQTMTNSLQMRILNAQVDPAVGKMLTELPPQIRGNIVNAVQQYAGDKLNAPPAPWDPNPTDPVVEAIRYLHYNYVTLQGGGQPQWQANPAGVPTQPTQPPTVPNPAYPVQPVGFQPVPPGGPAPPTNMGSEADQAMTQMGDALFGLHPRRSRMAYPAEVSQSLGM